MKNIIEVYKGLSHQFTQAKLSVLIIEQAFMNKNYLDIIKFKEIFYNSNTFSGFTRALIGNLSIIQFCSFLEEYERFNTNQTNNHNIQERIINVRKQNKYGIRRINNWNDIQKFRNQLVAHNFQIKNKSFFDNEDNKIFEYNIPDTLNEKKVVIKIMEKICRNITSEFPEILTSSNVITYKMAENINIKHNNIDLTEELLLIDENM
jgi:fructose-specific phosphotransferase system component IIB